MKIGRKQMRLDEKSSECGKVTYRLGDIVDNEQPKVGIF